MWHSTYHLQVCVFFFNAVMITVFWVQALQLTPKSPPTQVNECTASEPITSVADKEWEVVGGCSWAHRCSAVCIWFAKKGMLVKRNQCYANTLSIVRWWSVTVAKAQWRLTLTFWAASVVGATGSRAVWSLNASEFRWLIHLNSGCLDLFWQDFFKMRNLSIFGFPCPQKNNFKYSNSNSAHSSLFLMLVSLVRIHAEQFGSLSFRSLLLHFTACNRVSQEAGRSH